jgi:RNA polymerase sigma factor (sigma-70 family)
MTKFSFTTDEMLITALKLGDNDALEFVYKSYWPMISKFVRCNSGSMEDAEELYQEGIIALYEKLRNQEFCLTCSIKTYVYSICRNKWLHLLRGRKIVVDIEEYDEISAESAEDIAALPEDHEIAKAIASMGDPCHSLLIGYYYHQLPLEILAEKLKYASPNVAKQQKFRCVERLKKIFMKNEHRYANE